MPRPDDGANLTDPPLVDGWFPTRLRVRYCECDPMGVAHHASCVPWFEIARTDLLRAHGMTYAELERDGVFLVVTRMDVRYRRPIRYDDLLDVRVRVGGGSRIKIRHEYEIVIVEPGDGRKGRIGDVAVGGFTEIACVGPGEEGPSIRVLPDWLVPDKKA